MKALVATIALLCLSRTAIAHDIYSNSVMQLAIYVLTDRIVSH